MIFVIQINIKRTATLSLLLNRSHAVISIILTFSLLAGCQTIPVSSSEESEIFDVDGSKEFVYEKSRQWFSEAFISGESVVDYESKSTGTIIAKFTMNLGQDLVWGGTQYARAQMKVETKEDRIRVSTIILEHSLVREGRTIVATNISQTRADLADQQLKDIKGQLIEYISSPIENW